MLAGQEEIMMFMEKRPMESDKGLPLLVVEFVVIIRLCVLRIVDLDTLGLHHDEAGVDTFDLGDELFLRYGPGLWLFDQHRGGVFARRPIRSGSRPSATARRRMACPWTSRWLIGQPRSMSDGNV
jgi:hypothetical protein